MTISNRDPLNIDGRAYEQLGRLLDFMETNEAIPFKERYAALGIILRLRDLAARREEESGGESVRKYAAAFAKPPKSTAHAAGRRKARARNKPAPDDDDNVSYLRYIDGGDRDNVAEDDFDAA